MSKAPNSFEIEHERLQFKQLLALNPNHFGNLPSSQLPSALYVVCNAKYEQISGVAYNPDLDLLEAVVQIKLPFGYNGKLCGAGSREFVRFFVDYGCGWKDAGIASFQAHDIADDSDREHSRHPLSYAVSLPHQPIRDNCNHPVIPKVRAILSWEAMPAADPDWKPVWGHVLEKHVQVSPRARKLIELASDIVKTVDPEAILPDEFDYLEDAAVDVPIPPSRPVEKLAKLYSHDQATFLVEPHRFAMPDVRCTLATSFLSDATTAKAKFEQYQSIGLDWQSIVAELDKTQGDVSYEQLSGVGFDYNREWAVANLTIKRPMGYLGSLCNYGSDEHIAFWIDWDANGEWIYLATVAVRVHDIATIPAEGLDYWVGIPLRLGEHRRSCKEAKMGCLRAVLSWHVPPSAVDPDAVPAWGNRLDAHFEIKPGVTLGDLAAIDAIGGINVAHINVNGDGMTVPYARFAETGSPADPWEASRRCAFGGDICVSAEVPVSFSQKAYKYRLLIREGGSIDNGLPLMSSFVVTRSLALGGGTVWISPELGSGWVNYLHPDQNIYSVLGTWQSSNLGLSGRNERWEIKLQLADASSKVLGDTGWLRVKLDNKSPVAEIHLDSDAQGADCRNVQQDDEVAGHFVAYDANGHFGAWALDMMPDSQRPQAPVASPFLSKASATGAAPGHGWRLNTASNTAENPLQDCVYRVILRVWDNTIVHSSQFLHNYAEDHVELILRANT